MKYLLSIILCIVGFINFYPIIGVLSVENINHLYAVELANPDLTILMQHRAILLGLIGGFIIFSAFRPTLQTPAIIIGFISMLSFLLLAFLSSSYNAALSKVVMADIIALALLMIAVIIKFIIYKKSMINGKNINTL